MKNHQLFHLKKIFLSSLIFIGILLLACRFIPWDRVNWGKLELLPGSAITVAGEAKQDLSVQIARFTAAVTAEHKDKQAAIDQVNQKMTAIIKAIKDFGIEDKDIQTQTISVNQVDERSIRTFSAGNYSWQAGNSIEIILHDINQASALADLLNSTEATNINGPRFSVDDTQSAETDLLQAAIDNAREKGEVIAKASKRQLGKILTVTEQTGYIPAPVFRSADLETITPPTPVEPGTETLTKTVSVTFELK